jgi:hypothetical protein
LEKFPHVFWRAPYTHVETSMIFTSVVEGTLIPTSVGASSSKGLREKTLHHYMK